MQIEVDALCVRMLISVGISVSACVRVFAHYQQALVMSGNHLPES